MKYAQIRKMDISNGDGIGVSIFTQGCCYFCRGCHNSSIWNFDNGKNFIPRDMATIIQLFQQNQYLTRLSILGGEPLLPQNVSTIKDIVLQFKSLFPHKRIYLWTGTTFENLLSATKNHLDECDDEIFRSLGWTKKQLEDLKIILYHIDYLIDGRFVQEKKDLTLKWRGSSNQRILRAKESMYAGQPIEL